jgi:SpoVK/Ycf46/Vps4 family AAA+-type ATPase
LDDLARLEELLNRKQSLVVIQSYEEQRVFAMLERLAWLNDRNIARWSVTTGGLVEGRKRQRAYNTEEIAAALRYIAGSHDNAIYVFFDARHFMDNPVAIRLIKDVVAQDSSRMLVFIAADLDIPDDLKKETVFFAPALPDRARIHEILLQEARRWRERHGRKAAASRQGISLFTQHLRGLTESDIRKLCRMSIEDDGALTAADIERVLRHKYQSLDSANLLTLEMKVPSLDQIGGLDRLKEWLRLRREVFLDPDNNPDLPAPKGMLLLGVQGAGKSLAAKCVAGSWQLPLLQLDFGRLYGQYHGESEANLRNALNIVCAMSPCVLWLDEIEKGLAAGGFESDGGVSKRVLATLLTWMSERADRVFIVATANDISALPPELLRKGRFDEIFFVDLPAAKTRARIFSIHLKKRRENENAFDTERLSELSEGFSGAEIEQAILSAGYAARSRHVPVSQEDVEYALSQTFPLSVVMAERVDALRQWALSRTVPAD